MTFALVLALFLLIWGLVFTAVGHEVSKQFAYKKHLQIAGPVLLIVAGLLFTLTCLVMAI